MNARTNARKEREETVRIWDKHHRVPQMDWSYVLQASKGRGRSFAYLPYKRGITEWQPAVRGGCTECFIYDDEMEKILAQGTAVCSVVDNFCYDIGRKIAFGRAMKALQRNVVAADMINVSGGTKG